MKKQSLARTAGQRIMTVIGILLCIVLIPMLVANLTIIVKSFVTPDKVPGFMGYKPFIDLTDSMYPAIKAGDLVIVKETDAGKLQKGDVIAFREGKSVITHRIIDVKDSNGSRQYITKGDNNNTQDASPVLTSAVEGKFIMDIPKLGNGALFMQTPVGMVIFIALPLLLFILYDFLRRKLYDRPKAVKEDDLQDEIRRMRQRINQLENDKSQDPGSQIRTSRWQDKK